MPQLFRPPRAPGSAVLTLMLLVGTAQAAPPPLVDNQLLRAQALAATCAQYHGTDGRSAPGLPVPVLAGMPRDDLIAKLQAFRIGQAPSTVMQQIVRGYTDAQLAQVAQYFSEQR